MDDLIKEGLIYIPKYVSQESDMDFGDVVTHENYNEKLNLNTKQGDYNTEILKLLFNETDQTKVPHIPYIENIIKESYNTLSNKVDTFDNRINTNTADINTNKESIADILNTINSIKVGTTVVGYATVADKIKGIDTAGARKYYGTDKASAVGFYEMPASLFARDVSSSAVEIDGIYYTPRLNSVTEDMLVETVREKLNRANITEYDKLSNLPLINGYKIVGNVTLENIGAQPAGNYLTEIPEAYTTIDQVNDLLAAYLKSADASDTYALISTVSSLSNTVTTLSNTVNTNKTYAEGRYARICVGSFSGTPKAGDMLVTL